MVLNAAVQSLREAEELKQKISKFKSGTSMIQERGLWATQQQLQKVYQKVLVLDLDYALDKKVEQDLWNYGFKQQIEALQAISKDRKNPSRSEGQAMLSWVLQAATGFYLCLLHQICTTFKLDLPFRRRASLVGCVEGWGAGGGALPAGGAARYVAQHCLVHLGDLARYRQNLTLAHTFYRHALVVSAQSGQPYNQLALVAWRRGRRLAAVYWHVRSLLVRAPFPPAANNLARTLAAAAGESKELPVLPGITDGLKKSAGDSIVTSHPLDAHTYVTNLLKAIQAIYSLDDLETATRIVSQLNASLPALVATDSFEAMTLIRMSCIVIWLVQWSREETEATVATEATEGGEARRSEEEEGAARLADSLAATAIVSATLPIYTRSEPPKKALPALKVWLQWLVSCPTAVQRPEFVSRPQLWPALASTLSALAGPVSEFNCQIYQTLPLPEDEELHGFLPLEEAMSELKFSAQTAWETYGDRIPDFKTYAKTHEDGDENLDSSISEMSRAALINEPDVEEKVRAHRIVQLGVKLAELLPDALTVTTSPTGLQFTSHASPPSLAGLVRSLLSSRPAAASLSDDDDEPQPRPPVVISEADFREKVREKRVGILKPQGSLERAREERALAFTQEEQDFEVCEDSKGDDSKKEAPRKPRMNVAMAAIMRKQEETNKQVKFITPPPTPDSIPDNDASTSGKEEKQITIQPKAIKSLANLPIGRKTGGILSLKDKSAGYPHLVNAEPEPIKKPDNQERKEQNANQNQNSQTYSNNQKTDPPASSNWGQMQNQFNEPRFNLQNKNYGLQNTGLNYNPNYQSQGGMNVNAQGIRLPVVNPKEIDVRSAALQKQNSRPEMYHDSHKFGNHNYQISGDKKNFLSDLPPRFANQYRHWQNAQEQSQDNKFRDENYSNNTLFGSNNRPNWMSGQSAENFQAPPPSPWWKPDQPPNFAASNYSNIQPNFYSPQLTNMTNAYQNMSAFPISNPMVPQMKPENMSLPNYSSTIGQPQPQNMQGLMPSQNFNNPLNNFGNYGPVRYDSAMYPQFNKLGYQGVVHDKSFPPPGKDFMGLGFGSHVNMNYNDQQNIAPGHTMDQSVIKEGESSEGGGNTYSLFSGAADVGGWGNSHAHPQQSLWSGPGPSPLERLLEQQKQLNQRPSEPQ